MMCNQDEQSSEKVQEDWIHKSTARSIIEYRLHEKDKWFHEIQTLQAQTSPLAMGNTATKHTTMHTYYNGVHSLLLLINKQLATKTTASGYSANSNTQPQLRICTITSNNQLNVQFNDCCYIISTTDGKQSNPVIILLYTFISYIYLPSRHYRYNAKSNIHWLPFHS